MKTSWIWGSIVPFLELGFLILLWLTPLLKELAG